MRNALTRHADNRRAQAESALGTAIALLLDTEDLRDAAFAGELIERWAAHERAVEAAE